MAAKTTKGKKASTSKKKKSTASAQAQDGLYSEIVILISLAVCVLLILSNFGIGGIVGGAVSSVLFGIFGFLAYIMPILLFCGVWFLISNKGNGHAYLKFAAAVLFICMLCTFLELITNSYSATAALGDYYKSASAHRNAGGLVGGLFVHILCPLFGVAGTYVLVIVLLLISMILITERSLFKVLKKGGAKAGESARRRRETALIRKQELQKEAEKAEAAKAKSSAKEKKTRKDQKVSGVSFATTLVGKSPNVKELYAEEAAENAAEDPMTMQADDFVINRPQESELFADLPEDSAVDTEPVAESVPVPEEKPKKSATRKKKTDPEELSKQISSVEEEMKEYSAETLDSAEGYSAPPLTLLKKGIGASHNTKNLQEMKEKLQNTLDSFNVTATVGEGTQGPAVTRYEIKPGKGVKVSKIVGLADDIKLELAVADLRIEAPIPGKAAIGIEVPNKETVPVMLRDLLENEAFKSSSSKISFAVGKDISGRTIVSDIAKMPHLLVAGATGSGKSVCINTLIMSILYKASPDEVKMIMIDPKVVELSVYNGIPHLLQKVVTDPKKASGALNWAVAEMMNRYQLFAEFNVRDMKGFNTKLEEMEKAGTEENLPKKMYQLVIIVDELADLMMVAPGEVENAICRLAQLARAAGIHLILATQRPSVNVITGLIKANMPSRIAFSTTSGVDSRTIIDMNGAEKLLGKGDMLFYPTGYPKPVRVQGAFVSDQEVQNVVDYLKKQYGETVYNTEIESYINTNIPNDNSTLMNTDSSQEERDAYFIDAGKLIIEKEKASIGMLQRMFKIGFNRAARIMDQLAEAGVVGGEEGTKPRKILMTMEEFEDAMGIRTVTIQENIQEDIERE